MASSEAGKIKEVAMRMAILATLMTIAVSLAGLSQTLAAPASGAVIRDAASTGSPVTKVPCAWRRVGRVSRRVCW